MKFTAPAPVLKAALARVGKIVAARTVIPILSTVKFTAGDAITVTATDLEISAEIEVDGAVTSSGAACIPVAELTRLINLARNADVEISVADDVAAIRFGSASAELFCLPVADFPLAKFADDLPHVDGGLIGEALRFCANAASHEEARYYLNGVFMHQHNGSVVSVSTDGHRMNVAEMPGMQADVFGIIPNRAVALIAEAANPSLPFQFSLTERAWEFRADGVRMKGPCIDGTFPDWTRVAPGVRASQVAIIDAGEIATAAEIAAVGFENRKSTAVLLEIDGGTITLTGHAPGKIMARAASKRVSAEVFAPGVVCLNGAYLAAALAACGEGRVALGLFDGSGGMDIIPAEQRVDLRLSARVVGIRIARAQEAA